MGRFKNFLSGARGEDASPPRFLRYRSSKAYIITTICVAVFTDIFLYGVIVPVIPFVITARAGIAESARQSWVSILLAVYGAAILVLSPFTGWYADRSPSRRWPLLIGLVALGASTVLLCLARNIGLLVLGRMLQGFSGAVVWTVGQALLVDTVGQKEIGQTLGWVSLSMTVGSLIAPLLGGLVYSRAGYYAVFYMAFALVFLDIVFRLAMIEKKIALQWLEDPSSSNTHSRSGVPNLSKEEKFEVAGLDVSSDPNNSKREQTEKENTDLAENHIHNSLPENSQLATRFSKYPPIFTLLTSRRLVSALWCTIVQAALMTAFDSTVPLFVQRVFHWNSLGAGLIFLATLLPSFAAPAVGFISDHYGPRYLTFGGFVLGIPFYILLRLVKEDTLKQKVLLCALIFLIGVALTCVMPPLMAEITYLVEAKEKKQPGIFGNTGAYAQAYGLFITAFAAGVLIGPIWAGYVEDKAGWGTMTWTLGLLSLSGAVPALIFIGGLITKDDEPRTGDGATSGPAADSDPKIRADDAV